MGDELVIVVIDSYNSGLFIIPKEVAVNKRILSTRDSKGKMAMRFYPPWCTNLNKTAQSTQKWQLEYFRAGCGAPPLRRWSGIGQVSDRKGNPQKSRLKKRKAQM